MLFHLNIQLQQIIDHDIIPHQIVRDVTQIPDSHFLYFLDLHHFLRLLGLQMRIILIKQPDEGGPVAVPVLAGLSADYDTFGLV